jgi:Flp pilus assembly protein TadD
MSALTEMHLALDAIEDARKRLNRASDDADDDYEIRQALKFLEDAAGYLKKAAAELKQQA